MGTNEFFDEFEFNFLLMAEGASALFELDADKEELWELYLNSIPAEENGIFRKRRHFDCSSCRNFIRKAGNLAAIRDNQLKTIWDFETDDVRQPALTALSEYLRDKPVANVFYSDSAKIGTRRNFERLEDGTIHTWDHFALTVPNFSVIGKEDIPSYKARSRDTQAVFRRSLTELSEDSVRTVLELIAQNSLYKGEEWEYALKEFLKYKNDFMRLQTERERELFAWEKSVAAGGAVGRIRNHSMGTLLIDISAGTALDEAVRKYEAIVAPSNYKRPKPIFTQEMLDAAKKELSALGYMHSLARRHATLDDITVNNILFSNRDAAARIAGSADDIFAAMAKEAKTPERQFTRVEEVAIGDFIEKVLPTASEIEVYFESRHSPNMVSLIAPLHPESKTMFKWDNGFSWAYSGNLADSALRRNVAKAGGNVEGALRFSIQWNDTGEYDPNDLDAHCREPNGFFHLYFGNKYDQTTGGCLDVDIINPKHNVPAVENITWPAIGRMIPGKYRFSVHGYTIRGKSSGFRAEIEFGGEIYAFDYRQPVGKSQSVDVADVFLENGAFRIDAKLPYQNASREIWGLSTNRFIPVSTIMYSPNYWDGQRGVGNRHYFFMLKNCVNPESPNGFYNEFLREDLMKHKNFLAALGGKMAVEAAADQLSGLGFSSTKHDELVVKVKGAAERTLKIKI